MIRTRVTALLLLCAPACAPIVTHGPRVEPGFSVTSTVGVPHAFCDSACGLELAPQLGFGARWGRAADPGRAGYSITGTFSSSIISSEADLYVQAPERSDWAMGGGVLLSPNHVMPYVQAGLMDAGGAGFYTTQGFVVMAERPRQFGLIDEPSHLVRPRYWAPTLAYRMNTRRGAIHLYVSGALGWMDRVPQGGTTAGREPVRGLMAGISAEQPISFPLFMATPPPPPGPPPPEH